MYRITGKFGKYYINLANEPFERILIWCLRRCYYSTNVAVHWKYLIWRSK